MYSKPLSPDRRRPASLVPSRTTATPFWRASWHLRCSRGPSGCPQALFWQCLEYTRCRGSIEPGSEDSAARELAQNVLGVPDRLAVRGQQSPGSQSETPVRLGATRVSSLPGWLAHDSATGQAGERYLIDVRDGDSSPSRIAPRFTMHPSVQLRAHTCEWPSTAAFERNFMLFNRLGYGT